MYFPSALIVTRSVSEVGADSRLNSSLALRVTMAAPSVFRKVTIKALSFTNQFIQCIC